MPQHLNPTREPNGAPVLLDDEKVARREENCELFFGSESRGKGPLILTNKRFIWLREEGPDGVAMDYPTIILHAISTDTASFPKPCLYCQLKGDDAPQDDEEEDVEPPAVPEMRIVPDNEENLKELFNVMSDMATLNPDPADEQQEAESDDDEDDDAWLGEDMEDAPEPEA